MTQTITKAIEKMSLEQLKQFFIGNYEYIEEEFFVEENGLVPAENSPFENALINQFYLRYVCPVFNDNIPVFRRIERAEDENGSYISILLTQLGTNNPMTVVL
jgi:hypothetical protein